MINKITYDWHQFNDGQDAGEDMEVAEVGCVHRVTRSIVTKIEPFEKGYAIHHEDETIVITYNPNMILIKIQ